MAVAGIRASSLWSKSQTELSAGTSLSFSNEWERTNGRRLADGIIEHLVSGCGPSRASCCPFSLPTFTVHIGITFILLRQVQVHASTTLQLSSGKAATWYVERDGVMEPLSSDGPSSSVEHTFTTIGAHKVVAEEEAGSGVSTSFFGGLFGLLSGSTSGVSGKGAVHHFVVRSKTIRYELRDLSRADREAYFDALHSYYVIGQVNMI
jgi:hypothetical protein